MRTPSVNNYANFNSQARRITDNGFSRLAKRSSKLWFSPGAARPVRACARARVAARSLIAARCSWRLRERGANRRWRASRRLREKLRRDKPVAKSHRHESAAIVFFVILIYVSGKLRLVIMVGLGVFGVFMHNHLSQSFPLYTYRWLFLIFSLWVHDYVC